MTPASSSPPPRCTHAANPYRANTSATSFMRSRWRRNVAVSPGMPTPCSAGASSSQGDGHHAISRARMASPLRRAPRSRPALVELAEDWSRHGRRVGTWPLSPAPPTAPRDAMTHEADEGATVALQPGHLPWNGILRLTADVAAVQGTPTAVSSAWRRTSEPTPYRLRSTTLRICAWSLARCVGRDESHTDGGFRRRELGHNTNRSPLQSLRHLALRADLGRPPARDAVASREGIEDPAGGRLDRHDVGVTLAGKCGGVRPRGSGVQRDRVVDMPDLADLAVRIAGASSVSYGAAPCRFWVGSGTVSGQRARSPSTVGLRRGGAMSA